jgi:hypothetical protein
MGANFEAFANYFVKNAKNKTVGALGLLAADTVG